MTLGMERHHFCRQLVDKKDQQPIPTEEKEKLVERNLEILLLISLELVKKSGIHVISIFSFGTQPISLGYAKRPVQMTGAYPLTIDR